jgi:hypothetical protein
MLEGSEVNGTGSGWCPMAIFGINGTELSSHVSSYRNLAIYHPRRAEMRTVTLCLRSMWIRRHTGGDEAEKKKGK